MKSTYDANDDAVWNQLVFSNYQRFNNNNNNKKKNSKPLQTNRRRIKLKVADNQKTWNIPQDQQKIVPPQASMSPPVCVCSKMTVNTVKVYKFFQQFTSIN